MFHFSVKFGKSQKEYVLLLQIKGTIFILLQLKIFQESTCLKGLPDWLRGFSFKTIQLQILRMVETDTFSNPRCIFRRFEFEVLREQYQLLFSVQRGVADLSVAFFQESNSSFISIRIFSCQVEVYLDHLNSFLH